MPTKPGPIILVDDDPVEHQIVRDVLEAIRYNDDLICFDNGADVIKFLKTTSQQPFIILSDIRMPRVNGLELREAINIDEQLRQKSIPFMFLSTTANPHEVRKAYDLTVQGFFEKSPTVPAMQQQLKLIIDYWSRCKHPNSIGQGAVKVYQDETALPSRSPS